MYKDHFESGIYHCRHCYRELYESGSTFHSYCGWPSFDDEIDGLMLRKSDLNGHRAKIVYA
ncbi:MAG: hypothetical protein CMK36_02200 [Porticoccaceae bacterium]|nr:hypothetical protein [Porticoccaceae bacterium]